jgi:hypothetical protein
MPYYTAEEVEYSVGYAVIVLCFVSIWAAMIVAAVLYGVVA